MTTQTQTTTQTLAQEWTAETGQPLSVPAQGARRRPHRRTTPPQEGTMGTIMLSMGTARMSATESADQWDTLAANAERMAAWNRERGIDLSLPGTSPGDHKARQYRRTAAALRLEASTGLAHCSCHQSPACPSASRGRG